MAQPSRSKYAIGILAATFALSTLPFVAFAEDIDTDPQPDALQLEVERSAEAYQSAIENMTEIEDALAENEARIAELQKLIPEQQRKSNEAAVALYKAQIDSAGLHRKSIQQDCLTCCSARRALRTCSSASMRSTA